MLILQTPRLQLRHFESHDLDALFALYRDPQMRQYFPEGVLSLAQTREELAWFREGHPEYPTLGLWATVERGTGVFLGRCGLLPWEIDGQHEIELAFLIDKARWGEGFATEAALAIVAHARDVLALRRLICVIHPHNAASLCVAAKIGMSLERMLPDDLGVGQVHSLGLARSRIWGDS